MSIAWSCDFETTTDTEDCRVWAWASKQIGGDKFEYGNTIGSFMLWLMTTADVAYFHNLKFDGEFIIYWLLTNGWKHTTESRKIGKNEFNTLISDTGQFYAMEIRFPSRKVKILDSLKILPLSVAEIAASYHLETQKLEIDYHEYREPGHIITAEELEYIRADVEIVAEALELNFEQGLTKMTQGSNALNDFKKILSKKRFENLFPILDYETDKDIRRAYKGGFTYAAPQFQGKDIGAGITLDVNSLYPSVMYTELLPHGIPRRFEGKYKADKLYPLYIQQIKCSFELKPDMIPTIQLKNNLSFSPTQYLTSSGGEEIVLMLTNVDLALFFDHYNVYDIEYKGGWMFQGKHDIFKEYIDKWIGVKNQATIDGNKGLRSIAKRMLNALYGKFGLNPDVRSKIPTLEDDRVKYKLGAPEKRKPIYIPMAAFTTSYSRNKTIRSAQKLYPRFMYADTDSLHLEGVELPSEIDIDPVRLGAWAHESTFTRARFIRAKTYIEEIDGELAITCAGMPKSCYEHVTWENFKPTYEFAGKKRPAHVKGGIVLVDTKFKIKE